MKRFEKKLKLDEDVQKVYAEQWPKLKYILRTIYAERKFLPFEEFARDR